MSCLLFKSLTWEMDESLPLNFLIVLMWSWGSNRASDIRGRHSTPEPCTLTRHFVKCVVSFISLCVVYIYKFCTSLELYLNIIFLQMLYMCCEHYFNFSVCMLIACRNIFCMFSLYFTNFTKFMHFSICLYIS